MEASTDLAAQIAAVETCCGWMFVPKGFTPEGGQRISARLMLKPFRRLDQKVLERLEAVFEDWPTWLARSDWKPDVLFAYSNDKAETVVRNVGKINIGKAFGKNVGEEQMLQRSKVWQAAFPNAGKTLKPVPRVKPKRYEAQPHFDAASGSNYLYGGLHWLAVAASVQEQSRPITEVGATAFNFANAPDELREAAHLMRQELDGVRAFTYRLIDRLQHHTKANIASQQEAGKATDAPNSGDAVLDWAAQTQGREGMIRWDQPPPEGSPRARALMRMLAGTAPDTPQTKAKLQALKDAVAAKASDANPENELKLSQDMQLIAHHGWLLRYLGLVVDFELYLSQEEAYPIASAAPATCPGAVVLCPKTGWPRMNPTQDSTTPHGLPQRRGIVGLNATYMQGNQEKSRFRIVQVDVHAAARKLLQMTASSASMADSAAKPTERTFETSAQSSVGLTVVDTLATYAKDNSKTKTIRAGDYRVLFAEDITIGIRPDVQSLQPRENRQPMQAPWKSLTGWTIREARVKAGLLPEVLRGRDITEFFESVDAGESMVGSSHRMLASNSGVVALTSEELFTWSGWSLAVGHPDPGPDGHAPAFSELHVNNLVITLQAKGDLPALRTGRGYRFAARAVYPDAGGLTLREGRALYACEGDRPFLGEGKPDEFVPCMRFEPLTPPDIHLGERLDYADFPQAAARKVVLSSSARREHIRKKEVRYIVPPAISLERAVTLGMYDSADRRRGPPVSAFKGVCLTQLGSFPNASNPAVPAVPSDSSRRSTAGDRSDTIFHESLFARDPIIPYLPDPWARRVIVGVYRASDSELLAWEYHDYYENNDLAAWPNCQALRLEVLRAQDRYVALPEAYGSTAGQVDLVKKGATMQLVVPPGENLHVRFWHEMDERTLAQSGIVDQMAEYLADPDSGACADLLGAAGCLNNKPTSRIQLINFLSQWSELRHARIRGQISRVRARGLTNIASFAMINPSELLEVVHAVDQPVAPSFLWSGQPSEEFEPNFSERYIADLPARRLRTFEQSFRFRRERARSDAMLAGDVEFDRATIQRLDIEVHWEDIDDDLAQPRPAISRKNAIVSVDNLPPVLTHPQGLRGHLPNSRVTPDVPDDNNLLLLDGVRTQLDRTGNEDLKDKKLLVNFGDARARIANLTITGLSRFSREYPESDGSFKSPQGKLQQVVCPASAPPRPVDLDYIIPQYRWLDNTDGHRSHVREGGCFRVWLRRPWFTSGPDERLAVICWPPDMFDKNLSKSKVFSGILDLRKNFRDPPQYIEKFVTRWGLDPLWAAPSNVYLNSIPPEAFRRHVCDVASLPMRTKEDACFPKLDLSKCVAVRDQLESYQADPAVVALVLYEPLYDDVSRRWYVDIQIDEKYAYYPFVRLALARYQRYALPGMELSDILVQEFVQLPPARKTQLTLLDSTRSAAGTTLTLRVSMAGAAGEAVKREDPWTTRVGARLEYLPLKLWQRMRESGTSPPGFHEVAWVPDGETVYLDNVMNGGWQLMPKAGATHTQLATGTVTLMDDRIYSVLVEEFELGWQDDGRKPLGRAPVVRRVFKDRLLVSELP